MTQATSQTEQKVGEKKNGWKRWIFRRLQKTRRGGADATWRGSSFQTQQPTLITTVFWNKLYLIQFSEDCRACLRRTRHHATCLDEVYVMEFGLLSAAGRAKVRGFRSGDTRASTRNGPTNCAALGSVDWRSSSKRSISLRTFRKSAPLRSQTSPPTVCWQNYCFGRPCNNYGISLILSA